MEKAGFKPSRHIMVLPNIQFRYVYLPEKELRTARKLTYHGLGILPDIICVDLPSK